MKKPETLAEMYDLGLKTRREAAMLRDGYAETKDAAARRFLNQRIEVCDKIARLADEATLRFSVAAFVADEMEG